MQYPFWKDSVNTDGRKDRKRVKGIWGSFVGFLRIFNQLTHTFHMQSAFPVRISKPYPGHSQPLIRLYALCPQSYLHVHFIFSTAAPITVTVEGLPPKLSAKVF